MFVSPRVLIRLVVIGFFVGPTFAAIGADDGPPNILFLLADDQRADTIAAHGNRHIKTPNLDRLAQRGFSFRRNYCFGSNSGAVCVPSRAMLLSGRTWLDVDSRLAGVTTFPELLRNAGYRTFGVGKWHNGEASFLQSIGAGKAIMFGGMSDHTKVPLADISSDARVVNRRTGAKFSSELFADAAVEFLENYQDDKPFLCYVAFTAPHDPRQPPKRFRQMYYDRRPPLPTNYLPQHPFDNGHMRGGRDENLAPWPRTREVVGDQLAEYYGMITHMDEQIGRVLAALKASGRERNTLIVYAADHGLAMGSHGLLGKQSLYEHSMRCPLIFVGPGVPQGESTEAFSYLFDIFPTLCEAAAVERPSDLAGHSLRPVWRGEKRQIRQTVFLPFQRIQRSVRNERWKLIRYPQINHSQLFDLRNDPEEIRNLATDPTQAGVLAKMTKLLESEQRRYGDRLALSSARPKKKQVDLTGRARRPDRWQPKWIREKYFGD